MKSGETEPATTRPRTLAPRRLAVAVAALSFALGLGACDGWADGKRQGAVRSPAGQLGSTRAALNPSITFGLCPRKGVTIDQCDTVSLELVYCSASIACLPAFLYDPGTAQRDWTLTANFSCGFTAAEGPMDGVLVAYPRLRCYAEGDPADETSWVPAGGTAIPWDGHHLYFSARSDNPFEGYVDGAQLLGPGTGYAFCEYEAYGAISAAPFDGQLRASRLVHWSPVVHWQGLLQPTVDGWACNEQPPTPLTGVESQVLPAVVFDHDPFMPGEQTLHDTVFVSEQPFQTVVAAKSYIHQAIMLRWGLGATYPAASDAPLTELQERKLWVMQPALGIPMDLAVNDACIQTDVNSRVERLGLALTDRSIPAPYGAIVVYRSWHSLDYECQRDSATGACLLVDERDWPTTIPCLL